MPRGAAGDRCFLGTLSFDDPAVADEFVVPYWVRTLPDEDGGIVNLTLDVAFGTDTSRSRRNLICNAVVLTTSSKTISNPSLSQNACWTLRIAFNLLPKRSNEHSKELRVGFSTPNLVK